MPEPTAELAALRTSTAALVHDLESAGWSDDDARSASLCDGWTRAHLLTHLARNADGIAATLAGALRGELVERYPDGWDARNVAIADGAGRAVSVLVADVRDSAQRLDRVLGAFADDPDAWDRTTDHQRPAARWVPQRLSEVEIHHVDLDFGRGPQDWPALLVADQLPRVVESLSGRTDQSLRVVATPDGSVSELAGSTWLVGESDDRAEVRAPDWALLAWGAGRGSTVRAVLADAPALAPWS